MQHDLVVENGSGATVLADMQAALQALASCQSGPVEPVTKYAGMFWLDTSVPPNGFLRQRNRLNTDWALVLGMPQQASDADLAVGSSGRFLTPVDVAAMQTAAFGYARNRIANGAMQISQENGSTAGTTQNFHAADQWKMQFSGGAHSLQQVASVTPNGSPKRIRWTVTTAQPTLGANDFATFVTLLEGLRVADFMYGTAAARRTIVRFGFRGPAGTYSLNLVNAAGNRTYIKDFTIAPAQANADTEQVMVIPGDTTGTWASDNSRGIQLRISLAAGSAILGTDAAWQAGSLCGSAAISNGMDTVGNVFEFFDFGMYLDLDGSGAPPRWQFPDEARELSLCQRYYVQVWSFWCGYHPGAGYNGSYGAMTQLPVAIRLPPTPTPPSLGAIANLGNSAAFATSGSLTAINRRAIKETRVHTATGESAALFGTSVAVNARM